MTEDYKPTDNARGVFHHLFAWPENVITFAAK